MRLLLLFIIFWATCKSSIEKKSDLGEIKILSPKSGEVWKIGQKVWVYWEAKSSEDGPERIDLDLYRGPGVGEY
jgi:hypothetical protein